MLRIQCGRAESFARVGNRLNVLNYESMGMESEGDCLCFYFNHDRLLLNAVEKGFETKILFYF